MASDCHVHDGKRRLARRSRRRIGRTRPFAPTARACRVDQELAHSLHPNQFFWRSGASTLICRSLLFPLAVVLSSEPVPIQSFCDHGWLELGSELVAADHHVERRFPGAELSPAAQEAEFVRSGPFCVADVALHLSRWTTGYSRSQADAVIWFRGRGADADGSEAVARSDAFIAEMHSRLGHPCRRPTSVLAERMRRLAFESRRRRRGATTGTAPVSPARDFEGCSIVPGRARAGAARALRKCAVAPPLGSISALAIRPARDRRT